MKMKTEVVSRLLDLYKCFVTGQVHLKNSLLLQRVKCVPCCPTPQRISDGDL